MFDKIPSSFLSKLKTELSAVECKGDSRARYEPSQTEKISWDILCGANDYVIARTLALLLCQARTDQADTILLLYNEGRIAYEIEGIAHEMTPVPLPVLIDLVRALINAAGLSATTSATTIASRKSGFNVPLRIEHISDAESPCLRIGLGEN